MYLYLFVSNKAVCSLQCAGSKVNNLHLAVEK